MLTQTEYNCLMEFVRTDSRHVVGFCVVHDGAGKIMGTIPINSSETDNDYFLGVTDSGIATICNYQYLVIAEIRIIKDNDLFHIKHTTT